MATVDALTFSITRTSFPDGHICSVDYSYFLHFENPEYVNETSFSITIELYGDDLAHKQLLGETPFDSHVVDKHTHQPIERRFVLPCELLNEAWGEDKIFLKLFVSASDGRLFTTHSATIHDRF